MGRESSMDLASFGRDRGALRREENRTVWRLRCRRISVRRDLTGIARSAGIDFAASRDDHGSGRRSKRSE